LSTAGLPNAGRGVSCFRSGWGGKPAKTAIW